jgi:hypothetical protein
MASLAEYNVVLTQQEMVHDCLTKNVIHLDKLQILSVSDTQC